MITPANRVWHHTLTVAAVFWAGYLVLVTLEATVGSNIVISGLFFLSIPMLVACPGDDSPSQTESSSTGSDTSGGPPATSSMTTP